MFRSGCAVHFTGINGSGKSQLVDVLAERLERLGKRVVKAHVIKSCQTAVPLRTVLIGPNHPKSSLAKALGFMALQAETIEKVILPEVEKGSIVLVERGPESTIAYDLYGDTGISRKISVPLAQTCKAMYARMNPVESFLLDAPAEICRARAQDQSEGDWIQGADLSSYERWRQGYKIVASELEFNVLNAELSTQELADQVMKQLKIHCALARDE